MKEMNVLSLFDGISCGQVALERAGIKVDSYFASEIDKYAIQVTMKNYPNTIQLGDVRNIDLSKLPKIDLLIGGSPCQDLSIARKDRKGLEGEKSSLFYIYKDCFDVLKPKYFIYENVASMPKGAKKVISYCFGVEPIKINSSLVSGQNRNRLYWTNIPNIEQPKDKNILLNDILEDLPFRDLKPFCYNKSSFGISGMKTICDKKFNNLTTSNTHSKMYILNADKSKMRTLSPTEYEKLQTLPINYTKGISNTQRYKCVGNGWTVDVVAYIFSKIK